MRWLPQTRGQKIRAAALLLLLGGVAGWFWVLPMAVWAAYAPREGDVLFQSLPGGVDLIEAIGPVQRVPLPLWIWRGRGSRLAAYRLKPEFQPHVPAMLAAMEKFWGRPYDSRYRLDDENIYCSELVYKGYLAASGRPLGRLVRLGELDWRPHTATIIKYDGCPPDQLPLDREIITPRDLAQAPELERVFNWGY